VENVPWEALASFGVVDEKSVEVVYHYCSTQTFLAIINTKTIRLSDINTMNDYAEMHWAYDKFMQAIDLELDKYDRAFLDEIDKLVSSLQLYSLPLISCFSKEADVLSQWRAYADNGAGVALGLDFSLLKKLAVRVGEVVYDEKKQLEYFGKLLTVAYSWWKAAGSDADLKDKFREFLFVVAYDNCLIKNPAFSEEKEIRLIRATTVERLSDGRWSLTDSEGSSQDATSCAEQKICFGTRNNGGIVAHIDLPVGGLGPKLVREVILGPRSMNNGIEVSMALTARGFTDFVIRESTATFR
jgi:hypothetical protein